MFPLIEAEALFPIIGDVKLLDATFGVPGAEENFARARIGRAQFFDIDAVADMAAPYAHTLPSPAVFAAMVGAMGIGADDEVVIYDQTGITFAAARAWWMFRAMGHTNVRVLNGGLPAWSMAGLPLEDGAPDVPVAQTYLPKFRPALVRDFDAMVDNTADTIIDARAAARFAAPVRSPDGDMQPAHIPGSKNQPFSALLDELGRIKDADSCAQVLMPHVETGKPVVATCGSGVTACVLALGFAVAGKDDVAVYDGSWTEWSDRLGLR